MKKKETIKPAAPTGDSFADFILRYANIFLVLAAVLVYYKTFSLTGLTHLDDTIFIFDKQEFDKHLSNILVAFNVGCFNEKDIYYRPVFLITFILEYQLAGEGFKLYHFTNLLLHCINILLLFTFLRKLNFSKAVAFVLTLIFAVHPVLTMAVAWIPGRNDLLLSVFTLSFFLLAIRYTEKKDVTSYILQLIFLFLALFTKETAVFIPFAAVLLFFCLKQETLLQKKYYRLGGGWLTALLLWYYKKTSVLPDNSEGVINAGLLQTFPHRVPGLVQYIGKIFLPFNLSAFPLIESTTFIYGFIAIVFLAIIILLNKNRDNKMILLGASWFILFILPFFFVPKNINDQLFEHRLYIPIIGIFILLNQSIIFSKIFSTGKMLIIGFIVAAGLSFLTFNYISRFDNELVYWSHAVEDSPQSAYANKMYGIKLTENKKQEEAIPFIRAAYRLDSTERYTNLFLARLIYIPNDSLVKAEIALRNEARINPSFSDTYFELAHVCFMRSDFECAKQSLIKYLEFRPADESSNNNLLKLYYDLKEYPEAKQQMNRMEQMGMPINGVIKATVDAELKK